MLSYNARYYDATIGRFISADTIVPGSASGGMDGIAVKPLTVDFHEGGFQSKLNQENALGFWFQLSDEQKQQAGSPWGPANAQALNRYSYVQNNPLKWTDPTGHDTCDTGAGGGGVVVNNTSHSVWVIGSVTGACPDGSGNGVVCDSVLVELAPGQSSVDAGMADVDAVVTHFNSDGTVEGYKLTSSEKATLSEDEKGNTIIAFEAKDPWLVPVVGAERKLRGITDLNSRKTTWGYRFIQTSNGKIFPAHKKSTPKKR